MKRTYQRGSQFLTQIDCSVQLDGMTLAQAREALEQAIAEHGEETVIYDLSGCDECSSSARLAIVRQATTAEQDECQKTIADEDRAERDRNLAEYHRLKALLNL